jgi:hypothetical protein
MIPPTRQNKGATMGEKIAKTGIRRDKDLRYYIHHGDIWAIPRERPGQANGKAQKVAAAGIEMDNERYLYYVDHDGDVARRSRTNHNNKYDDDDKTDSNDDVELHEELEAVRNAIGRVDALASLASEQFSAKVWNRVEPERFNRMGHLIAAIAEAASVAVTIYDDFRTAMEETR